MFKCYFILETANHEIQKRISDAFEVFDHEHNNTVDLREIGTIIRSLGKNCKKWVSLA